MKNYRQRKLGYELMSRSIDQIEKIIHYKRDQNRRPVSFKRIFTDLSGSPLQEEDYIEDGIPHTYMGPDGFQKSRF